LKQTRNLIFVHDVLPYDIIEPESESGLSVVATGNCLPLGNEVSEVVSSFIHTRQITYKKYVIKQSVIVSHKNVVSTLIILVLTSIRPINISTHRRVICIRLNHARVMETAGK
jgi:hypothetical protein